MLKPGGGPSNWKLPLSTARSASTWAAGQSVRLARVRLRVRRPSRQPSRRRMAGRELRFGHGLDIHGRILSYLTRHDKILRQFTWEHIRSHKDPFPFHNRRLMLDLDLLKAGTSA